MGELESYTVTTVWHSCLEVRLKFAVTALCLGSKAFVKVAGAEDTASIQQCAAGPAWLLTLSEPSL